MTELVFRDAGDCAISVELGDEISPAINRRVRALTAGLDLERVPGVIEIVPAYRSLLVYYDPCAVASHELRTRIARLAETAATALPPPRVFHVPTCYGGEYGPDMDFVATHTRLSPSDVVALHTAPDYLVYMIGFTPGYPYLGGLPPHLAVPRLATPRTRVPAGSVAIAQQQTGIYSMESPGGFRLIGRSPVRLFDASSAPPSAIAPGDFVRFVPIDADAYAQIEANVACGTYHLPSAPHST